MALIITMISGNIVTTAFTSDKKINESSLKQVSSDDIYSTNLTDLTKSDVVDIVNNSDKSLKISEDDVITSIDEDGSEVYIVPYNETEQVFAEPSLKDMAKSLKSDESVSNVKLKDNELTYTIFDDTNGKIIKTEGEDGKISFEVTEGDKAVTLTYDKSNSKMYLDGKSVKCNEVEAYEFKKE